MAKAVYGSGDFHHHRAESNSSHGPHPDPTLPSKAVGEYADYPFAIVIDQVEHDEVNSVEGGLLAQVSTEFFDKDAIVAATGATGVIVANGTLDVA